MLRRPNSLYSLLNNIENDCNSSENCFFNKRFKVTMNFLVNLVNDFTCNTRMLVDASSNSQVPRDKLP